MSSVPPPGGGKPPPPPPPDDPASGGSSDDGVPRQTMGEFLSTFTPEQKKKFWQLLERDFSRQIQRQTKKAVEQMKKDWNPKYQDQS